MYEDLAFFLYFLSSHSDLNLSRYKIRTFYDYLRDIKLFREHFRTRTCEMKNTTRCKAKIVAARTPIYTYAHTRWINRYSSNAVIERVGESCTPRKIWRVGRTIFFHVFFTCTRYTLNSSAREGERAARQGWASRCRGCGWEGKHAGVATERKIEKERERQAVILRVDLIGGIPAEEIPSITERQAGTYPRPVARGRARGRKGVARGMRVLHESRGIYICSSLCVSPPAASSAYTRVSVSIS